MPIQAGEIKLVKSQVMDDMPEGGGAPSGEAIRDGQSNAMHPDISEVARGRKVSVVRVFALDAAGQSTAPTSAANGTISYTYLPLDAELLGLDPVRLPSDGKAPIFRAGDYAVLGHKKSLTARVTAG